MNTKKKLSISIFCAIIIVTMGILGFLLFPSIKDKNEKPILGVWWWDIRLDLSYLEWASEQGVTEIYYYTSSFSEKTNTFIGEAHQKNIEVYWLTGEYQWIDHIEDLQLQIEEFLTYQNTYPNTFNGIHFDIEPHQNPDFETFKQDILIQFVQLAHTIKQKYPTITIAYDLPIWMEDEITYLGVTKPTYQFMIDYADRVTLMSYRDTAESILSAAQNEIQYAISQGKSLNLGVETQGNVEDEITFYEEGKTYMNQILQEVRESVPFSFGIAIHHIKSWYSLIS